MTKDKEQRGQRYEATPKIIRLPNKQTLMRWQLVQSLVVEIKEPNRKNIKAVIAALKFIDKDLKRGGGK